VEVRVLFGAYEKAPLLAGFSLSARRSARFVFNQVRDRSIEDLMLVFCGTDQRLDRCLTTVKQEQAYQCLKVYIDAEGSFPAAGAWDAWRRRPATS
jgi:hypothetical protein